MTKLSLKLLKCALPWRPPVFAFTVFSDHVHCHLVTGPGGFCAGYLGVLLVAAVDLGDALLGAFGGRRRGEGLLHPAGSLPQPTLDAKGFVQLVHLEVERETERVSEREAGDSDQHGAEEGRGSSAARNSHIH